MVNSIGQEGSTGLNGVQGIQVDNQPLTFMAMEDTDTIMEMVMACQTIR